MLQRNIQKTIGNFHNITYYLRLKLKERETILIWQSQ
ncbi:MAG: hypothetical protein ACI9XC_001172 [Gammaproteobacteria bacterium]|jgi:hypothetical protein